MLVVSLRFQKTLKKIPMQITEIVGYAETRPVFVVLRQDYAEVIIPNVRGEIVADDSLDPVVVFPIHDSRIQDFNQRKGVNIATRIDIQFNGNDIKLECVAITFRIVPVRQSIETIVAHLQGVAQIFLAVLASGQMGKVCRDACVARGAVILIKTNAPEAEREAISRCARPGIAERHAWGGNSSCDLRHGLPN